MGQLETTGFRAKENLLTIIVIFMTKVNSKVISSVLVDLVEEFTIKEFMRG